MSHVDSHPVRVARDRQRNTRSWPARLRTVVPLLLAGLALSTVAMPGTSAASPAAASYSWALHCAASGPGPNSARGSWSWLYNGTVIARGGTNYTSCPGALSGGGARPAHTNGIRVSFGVCAQAVCHVKSATTSFAVGGVFSLTLRLNQTVGRSTTLAHLTIKG